MSKSNIEELFSIGWFIVAAQWRDNAWIFYWSIASAIISLVAAVYYAARDRKGADLSLSSAAGVDDGSVTEPASASDDAGAGNLSNPNPNTANAN